MSEGGEKGHPSKLEGGHLHLDLEDVEKQTVEEGSSRPKPVEERRYRWEGQDDNEPIFGEEVWLHELQPFLCLIKLEYEIMHGWLVKAESWKDKWGKQDIKHYLEISTSKYFPHFWPIGWDICDMWPQSPKQLDSLPFTTGNLVNISPPPLPSHPPLPQRWNWAPRNGTYSVLKVYLIFSLRFTFFSFKLFLLYATRFFLQRVWNTCCLKKFTNSKGVGILNHL